MEVRRLRDKMLLAAILIIIPFIIWNVFLQVSRYIESYDRALLISQKEAQETARMCTGYIVNLAALHQATSLALWEEYRIPRENASLYLSNIAATNPSIRHISATDENGIIFAANESALIGHDLSKNPAIQRIINGEDSALSDVFWHETDQRNVIGFVKAVRDEEGNLIGMVPSLMDEETLLLALLKDDEPSPPLGLFDSRGMNALTHGDIVLESNERDWAHLPVIQAALAGASAIVDRLVMPDGREMIAYFEPIPEHGWVVCVFRERHEVLAPVKQQAMQRFGIVTVLALGAIMLSILLGMKLSSPIVQLANSAKQVGEGNLVVRTNVGTGDEIELLGESFNHMTAALQARTSELNAALESERRQRETTSTMYNVANGLVEVMELDKRLDIIAMALQNITGAKRVIILLDIDDELVPVAGRGIAQPELLERLTVKMPTTAMENEEVLKGAPIIAKNLSEVPCFSPDIAEQLSIVGFVALPLARGGNLVGFAFLDNPGETAEFEIFVIRQARELANLATQAIQNSRLFEKERNIAHTLQNSLLPTVHERLGPYRLAYMYHAALQEAQIGGDFYDFIELQDEKLGIVVADVSGKGLSAAVFTAMGKYTLRAFISEDPDPGSAMTKVNKVLIPAGGEWGFVTMFYGLLDLNTGLLKYTNAGHPPGLLAKPSGEVRELPSTDQRPPLGLFPNIEYPQNECVIENGDVLVGYTDGLIEAMRDGELFEVKRLKFLIESFRHLPPNEIVQSVYRTVEQFSRGHIRDDVALLALKREGKDEGLRFSI